MANPRKRGTGRRLARGRGGGPEARRAAASAAARARGALRGGDVARPRARHPQLDVCRYDPRPVLDLHRLDGDAGTARGVPGGARRRDARDVSWRRRHPHAPAPCVGAGPRGPAPDGHARADRRVPCRSRRGRAHRALQHGRAVRELRDHDGAADPVPVRGRAGRADDPDLRVLPARQLRGDRTQSRSRDLLSCLDPRGARRAAAGFERMHRRNFLLALRDGCGSTISRAPTCA